MIAEMVLYGATTVFALLGLLMVGYAVGLFMLESSKGKALITWVNKLLRKKEEYFLGIVLVGFITLISISLAGGIVFAIIGAPIYFIIH